MTRHLKPGFTTGTAAAAAVKAALCFIVRGEVPESVKIPFLSEGFADIRPHRWERLAPDKALCTVIKDGGDDPDATDKAEIGAVVTLASGPSEIRIRGGRGVGRVTKPGLGLPISGPAINPGPVTMIQNAVADVLGDTVQRVDIEIFVEDGEKIAEKTLNARLGIVGGISILGTTGVVKPLSHEAYIATIGSALSVAAASGLKQAVFTTGRRSERFAMQAFPALPAEAFIQIGDFFKDSLEKAVATGFQAVTLAVFFGKAVKMAQGAPHTHASKSDVSLGNLAGWVMDISGNRDLAHAVRNANTARHAFELFYPVCPGVVGGVGRAMIRWAETFSRGRLTVRSVIFDFDGQVICDSDADRRGQ